MKDEPLMGIVGSARRQRPGSSMPDRCVGEHKIETIVGHVSLATGTVPAAHGMVGNVWFDRQEGRLNYNIEDSDHHQIHPRSLELSASNKNEEISPCTRN